MRKERALEAGLSRLGFNYISGIYFQLVKLLCLCVLVGQLAYYVGFRDETHVSFGSKCLYLLTHLARLISFIWASPFPCGWMLQEISGEDTKVEEISLCVYQLRCAYACIVVMFIYSHRHST